MTPELIAGTAGITLSLIFSYAPILREKFDALSPTAKRLSMLSVLLLAALGTLLYQCRAGGTVCLGVEWEKALSAFIHAAIANQATHGLTPLSTARVLVRAEAANRAVLTEITKSDPPAELAAKE